MATGVTTRPGVGRTSHEAPRRPDPALEARLRCRIDEARHGRKWSCYEAIKLLRDTGRFLGLDRKGARRAVARWLEGVNPDIVSEAWAEFVSRPDGGIR